MPYNDDARRGKETAGVTQFKIDGALKNWREAEPDTQKRYMHARSFMSHVGAATLNLEYMVVNRIISQQEADQLRSDSKNAT